MSVAVCVCENLSLERGGEKIFVLHHHFFSWDENRKIFVFSSTAEGNIDSGYLLWEWVLFWFLLAFNVLITVENPFSKTTLF